MATPSVLSKVHTFAQDLEQARIGRGQTPAATPSTAATPIASAPTPRVQATSSTAKQAVPAISQSASSTPTVVTAPATPVKLATTSDRDASYPATIITDKKRHKFNLTEEVSTAIGDWWNEKVKTIKKNKKPTYRVPAVERRKGVVQAATTQTGRAATTDYSEVVAKLKTEPVSVADKAAPAIAIAPAKAHVPEAPTWDTQSIALDAVVPDIAVTQVHTSPLPASKATAIPVQAASTIAAAPVTVPVPSRSNIVVTEVVERGPRIVPTIPIKPTVDASRLDRHQEWGRDDVDDTSPRPAATKPTPQTNPVVVKPITPSIPSTPVTPISFPKINPVIPTTEGVPPKERRESAFAMLAEVPTPTLPVAPSYVKDTIAKRKATLAETPAPNPSRFADILHFAPYLAGGAFVLVTIGTIGYFMLSGTSTPSTDNLATDLPTLPSSDTEGDTSPLPLAAAVSAQLDAPNKSSLYTAIKNTAGLGEGLHIVTPLGHDTAMPLSSREILSLINRQFAPAFLGDITSVQVGMYRDEPVLLLSVSDENNARGGMFKWEATLSQDLSPWFGVPLRHTSTSSLTSFKDSTSAGRDVRILTDDIGTERITYGFLHPYLILVTTNTTAFLNISDSYKGY
jgi:hypothetical protein